MTISPSTDLYLLKLPIELNDENQLTFDDATAQATYFLSLDKIGDTDFSYQRRESAIRYPAHIDSIIQYNYVMYKNENYSSKWFYARIMNMEYINDGMTLIQIEEDAFQTWQFELNYTTCFVEREHVMDDTIGLHTIPEDIETGEYEIVDKKNIPLYESATPATDWCICFCVTKLPSGISGIVGDSMSMGGVFSSLQFFAIASPIKELHPDPTVPIVYGELLLAARAVIRGYEVDGTVTSDAIKNVYMIPRSAVETNPLGGPTEWEALSGATVQLYAVNDSMATTGTPWQQKQLLAGNYQPMNNKLYCWPYSYAYFSNKAGDQLVVRWEDFPTETIGTGANATTAKTINYKTVMVPSTSLSAKLYLTKYKGYNEGQSYGEKPYEYGINFAKAPVCAWTTDYYLNWLTQNGVNQATSIVGAGVGGALGIAGAAIAGGPVGLAIAGAIAGTSMAVANAIGSQHQASVTPNNANGDVTSADVMFAYNRCSMSLYFMSVRPEYAYMADSYFNAYGYKVNELKTPNITGRVNWNFVKTVGSAIHADIPQDSCDRINKMFDNGITFWHHPQTFRDYWQPNDIISPSA